MVFLLFQHSLLRDGLLSTQQQAPVVGFHLSRCVVSLWAGCFAG